MKKRNKIILCLCSILVLMASIFSFIPTKSDRMQVSADEVVYVRGFETEEFLLPFSLYLYNSDNYANKGNYDNFLLNSQGEDNIYYGSFSFYFRFDSSNYLVDLLIDYKVPSFNNDLFPIANYLDFPLSSDVSGTITKNQTFRFNEEYCYRNIFGSILYNNYTIDSNGLYSIYCGDFVGVTLQRINGPYHSYSNLEFFDKDGNKIVVSIWSKASNLPEYTSTYYFQPDTSLSDNAYYNQGYQSGKQDGYNIGYTEGESLGYNKGYNNGYNFGFNTGYSEGSEDSNQYTFLNLVSATIDAPLTYFQSLFNFELLGVNLQGFLMALFTLCVIVTIVRLCLGR